MSDIEEIAKQLLHCIPVGRPITALERFEVSQVARAAADALTEQAAEIERLKADIEDLGYQLKEGYPDE